MREWLRRLETGRFTLSLGLRGKTATWKVSWGTERRTAQSGSVLHAAGSAGADRAEPADPKSHPAAQLPWLPTSSAGDYPARRSCAHVKGPNIGTVTTTGDKSYASSVYGRGFTDRLTQTFNFYRNLEAFHLAMRDTAYQPTSTFVEATAATANDAFLEPLETIDRVLGPTPENRSGINDCVSDTLGAGYAEKETRRPVNHQQAQGCRGDHRFWRSTTEAARRIGVSERTFHRRRAEHRGRRGDRARGLKRSETDNGRLNPNPPKI